MKYDFGGYATKSNLRCADGRTILSDAFAHQNGATVPLVWNHQRNDSDNVLGHAYLERRDDGMYAYCKFNTNPRSQRVKAAVENGDLDSLSIFANHLSEANHQVSHGMIREVSLVYAGANPGAKIDNVVIEHSDGSTDIELEEAVIYSGAVGYDLDIELNHADDEDDDDDVIDSNKAQQILNSMNDDQKRLLFALVGSAAASASHSDVEDEEDYDEYDEDEDDDDAEIEIIEEDDEDVEHSDIKEEFGMKYNPFEGQTASRSATTLTHADFVNIVEIAKRSGGSLKEATMDYLQHKIDEGEITLSHGQDLEHGIQELEILFPEARATTNTPDFIQRDMEWVSKVWNATRKLPFSRIKSVFADITKDEARARGYIKGNKKVEEQFGLLKRYTTPQTVYKLQKMDRDDIIDITDFDIVAWLKSEMRVMLNEELARAVLIGDGREVGNNDKIGEDHIRPVFKDADMYTIHYKVDLTSAADENARGKALIKAALKARKGYKGSGSPVFYGDTDTITQMLLVEDMNGRRIYNTVTELATALRVREIVEVPVMENLKRKADQKNITGDTESKEYKCLGLIVNLTDYAIGADRGGAVTLFDDFDIDYNKYTYLIETRCSGALQRPYSAISLEEEVNP